MKVLDIKRETPGPQKSQIDSTPPTPSKCALLGQASVPWAVLSILFHQILSPLLTSKGMRTGEIVWRDPKQAAPRLCHQRVK